MTSETKPHNVRLIDLDVYEVGGQRRYAYVGIRSTGVDQRDSWWWPDVTPAFARQQALKHGARIINVARSSPGRMAVVMQSSGPVYSRQLYDVTWRDVHRLLSSNGLRITDLDRYTNNGEVRFAASMIDNANAENQRIRAMWKASTMADASPGTDAWFGMYAKEVGGGRDVGLADAETFQPSSVQKLIPHLYVMDLLDKDPSLGLLDDPAGISWTSPPGNPDAVYCPSTYTGLFTQGNTGTLRSTLSRALGESLTRAHEALVTKYGATAINDRIHAMGLTNTNVYPGCPQPAGVKDWTSNTTTLTDLGAMFEKVDTQAYFPNRWAEVSEEFYGLMANWDRPAIQNVVADEAAKVGKTAIVSDFMSEVTFHGKAGGTDWSQGGAVTAARSFFGRVALPFVTGANGATTLKTFVGGYFVDAFAVPCIERLPATTSACATWKTAQAMWTSRFTGEPFRLAIRRALQTWPSS